MAALSVLLPRWRREGGAVPHKMATGGSGVPPKMTAGQVVPPKMAAGASGVPPKMAVALRDAMAAEGPQGPLSLCSLSAAAVSRHMDALERDAWALPAPLLRGLLPLLNVFRLQRAETAARRAGISTQPIWRKLWDDVMKTRPPNSESITCWRKKFLETFFSNVLHGVLDVSSDWRLNDHHFLPLLHSSPHVSQLTLCNMLQGAVELTAEHNQKVLENLAKSLHVLKFRHLLSSDQSTRRSLVLLLHRLIHHGSVNQVSMYSWPVPDTVLLVLILSMSAGFWRSGNALMYHSSPCGLCREEDKAQSQESTQEQSERGCCDKRAWSDGENQERSPRAPEEADVEMNGYGADAHLNSVLSRPGSPLQNHAYDEASSKVPCDHTSIQGRSSGCISDQPSCCPVLQKTRRRLKSAVGKKRRCLRRSRGRYADPEDLYDFVFTVAREDKSGLLDKTSATEGENTENWTSSSPGSLHTDHAGCKKIGGSAGIFSLKAAHRFRSVSMLELFSIPLTGEMCRTLSNLLSSWLSLENLVLSYNGLGANIFCILSGLRTLSRHPDCHLRVVRVSDVYSHVPCMELVHCILSALPQLQTLSLSFDLKKQLEGNRPEGNPSCSEAEIPESCLEQLEIRFPREPLQTMFLLPVLKASKSLQQLSLDSATLPCSQELGLLLEALKECNPNLKKVSFRDMNLAEHQKEVLLLLQDPVLQEITFSFCRLFESSTAEFLSEIINTVKRNSSLKSLKLPGNRLGNHRLVALADIFSEDSSSSLCQLDVSSNCIKPDGLLEFTKKLEGHIQQRGGQIPFTHLCLFQNWLDQDAETAQEALRRLKAVCSVVNDSWDSSQAFADYLSVM
ncbi:leucine-rich repeat-containing protein 41 isoform X2 [Cuculus canorus]|uniref:leucine-rich repeat-containing protein 41 isoform X2 n=1 Tax=Cuculus canorus TaxID=55661 RepID=UPI0023AB0076|nr:leucine-rich repeat-containing protein 41 isoform X2 [Cuculus canorus]